MGSLCYGITAFNGLNPYAVSKPKWERPCKPMTTENSNATTMISYGRSARPCLITSNTATNAIIAFSTCA